MAVTNNVNIITDAEAGDSGNWDDSSGQASSQNTDIVFVGSDGRGRRVDNTVRWWAYDTTSADDQSASGNHLGIALAVLQQAQITDIHVLLSDSASGGQNGNWDGHILNTADFAGLTFRRGFGMVWVDVSRTRDAGSGTLTLSSARSFGAEFDMGDVGGNAQNCHIGAIRHSVSGLTVTGGTVSDPADIQELIDYDTNATDDRQLMVVQENFLLAPIQVGSSGSSVVFRGGNVVLLASSQPLSAADWLRITWDGGNASSDIDAESLTTSGIHHVVQGTAATIDLNLLTILNDTNAITLNSAVVWQGKLASSEQLDPSTADITGLTIQESLNASAMSISASLTSTDINFINNNTAGDIAHSVEIDTAATYTFDGWKFTNSLGRAGGQNGSPPAFNTNSAVDGSDEHITFISAHPYETGDAVVYSDRGGSQTIGLTDGNTYFVNDINANDISLHNSQADAESDSNRVDLTASVTGENHVLYSAKADVFVNIASGSVTINVVGGGDVPSVRIATGTATVTVNADTQVTLTGLVNPTEVRVYEDGTTTEIDGEENVTTGTFSFSHPQGEIVDIRIFATDYLPADILDFTIPASDTSIPVQQRFDRNYENP